MSRTDATAWDVYWQGARGAALGPEGGVSCEGVPTFWHGVFESAFASGGPVTMLDCAAGSGVVTDLALTAAAARADTRFYAFDYSANALTMLMRRLPPVRTAVADARSTPFADGAFGLVVSQFGLEYAGVEAFAEAARVLAPKGTFAALIHYKGGAIERECADNLSAIRTVLDADFLPRAKAAISAAFAFERGLGPRSAAEQAAHRFGDALKAMQDLLRNRGVGAANGLPARLYRDVGTLHDRRRAYDPADMYDWFDGMTAEVSAYAMRMGSMTEAALGPDDIRAVRDAMAAHGVQVVKLDRISGEPDEPAAWSLTASR